MLNRSSPASAMNASTSTAAEAGVRGHQHWNTTTTITVDSAAKATNLRPAKLPQVPTNERLSFAVDQFTGSGHKGMRRSGY